MKYVKHLSLLICILLCFCSCLDNDDTSSVQESFVESSAESIQESSQEQSFQESSAENVQESSEEESSEPEVIHSSFYLEGYSTDQVIEYFAEVVLNMEYTTGDGTPHLLHKWTSPIHYAIWGEATPEDQQLLEDFFSRLNTIEGFPGAQLADTPLASNFMLNFLNQDDFNSTFGQFINYEYAEGAVRFWYYNDLNNIYNVSIGYRTDIDQQSRNSIILEEIMNGLGITDTLLREDSITYQGLSYPQELTDMDWLILQLLYHPDMQCGMNLEQCTAVIQNLYY